MPDTPLNLDALAQLIMWKELPFGGNPDNYIRLDANAAHKVIELLKPHLAVAQPEVSTVEELDALPIGSAIIDKHGDVGLIDRDGTIEKCVQFAETIAMSIGYTAKNFLPVRVLHRPEVKP